MNKRNDYNAMRYDPKAKPPDPLEFIYGEVENQPLSHKKRVINRIGVITFVLLLVVVAAVVVYGHLN